ncbi:hypothetical protein BKA69DRAFT_1153003 [Paraphysoderma sedebokerense]|nr:hypothetical protein BKA69DRAFT_1153003 [Paraphysoderma sedebokerense]
MSLAATVKAAARNSVKSKKSVLTLTPTAISRIKELTSSEPRESKFLRVGVKKKGCSGLAYTLDYVPKKDKFDEEVKQDGISVLIDSKALFSILGSEMDYVQDKLSSQFVFHNPNVKESCGCGASFMV